MSKSKQEIINAIKDIEAKKNELREQIAALELEKRSLKETLDTLFYFTATGRNYDKYGNIICAGSMQFCLDYMQAEYPFGKMVNSSQFNDKDIAGSEVLGVLSTCTELDLAWSLCTDWIKQHADKQ